MRTRSTILALAILSSSFLWSCGSSLDNSSEPTLSGPDVIKTAQALAEGTRQATFQTLPPTPPPPTATPTPETPTPSPSPTSGPPFVTADYNANVRSGPDESFSFVDVMLQGQRGEVLGRFENPDYNPPTWWLIRRVGEGKDGWVWSGAVTLSGNESVVQVLQLSPTPEDS